MLTWKLWRALNKPSKSHPLFQRTVQTPLYTSLLPDSIGSLPQPGLMAIELAIFLLGCSATFLVAAVAVALFVIPGLVYLLNLYHGMLLALNVASAIATEHEHNSLEVLGVTPDGLSGIYWAIWSGCLNRRQGPDKRAAIHHVLPYSLRIPAILILACNGFMAFCLVVPWDSTTQVRSDLLLLAFSISLAYAVTFYIDYIQIPAIAGLIGALCATFTRDRIQTFLWTLGGFTLFQIVCYLVWLLVEMEVVRTIASESVTVSSAAAILGALSGVVLFIGLRETAARVLWRKLSQALEVDPLELDHAAGLKV